MKFGTIIVTKDRNDCLQRTLASLVGSDLVRWPVLVIDNGSEQGDPADVTRKCGFTVDLRRESVNTGIVGARLMAHRSASREGWDRYLYLQDDFTLQRTTGWLEASLAFMERFRIGYLRLTQREFHLNEMEHWVKQALRLYSGHSRWNGSSIQFPQEELVLGETFWITDRHYSDWVHIIDRHTSETVIEHKCFVGETIAERLLRGDWRNAWTGAVATEFDYAVKHWLAYSMGLVSATGVFRDPATFYGLFEHQDTPSAYGYRSLPADPGRMATL